MPSGRDRGALQGWLLGWAWSRGLLVALAFGGFLAKLGCDEQPLDLCRAQLAQACALSTDSKLVVGERDGRGERIVLSDFHGHASYGSSHAMRDDGVHAFFMRTPTISYAVKETRAH